LRDLASCGRPPSHRWRRRLLLDQHPVQLSKIALIEKPADHVRRDLACALRVELVPRHELEALICAGQRSHEACVEKARAGLDHNHPCGATVRMAVGQPEEGRGSV
jgi:hypothetical protein